MRWLLFASHAAITAALTLGEGDFRVTVRDAEGRAIDEAQISIDGGCRSTVTGCRHDRA